MKKMIQWVMVLMMMWPATGWSGDKDVPEGATTIMDEMVVTATKTKETRKDVPNAVMVVDEIDIKAAPVFSVGELLGNSLGLDWRTYGNYGGAAQNIRIRGIKPEGTQVYVNGVSYNSPSLGQADMGRIPLNNIERVEVVKGSGSLLYGTGAMGGTINIITKRPKREGLTAAWDAGYGTQKTYRLSVESGMFPIGDFGYYLTAQRRESDGFRDNSDVDQSDMSLKLVYDKGDQLDVSLYGDWITREYGLPGVNPPDCEACGIINGISYYNNESGSLLDHGSDEDRHVVLQVKTKPIESVSFSFKAEYTKMENYYYGRFHRYASGAQTWIANKVLGTEGVAEIRPFKGATLLLGGEARKVDWQSIEKTLNEVGLVVPAQTQGTGSDLDTTGTYAEVQYRPCKYVKGSIGIRHEDHSQFGDIDIPRFGLVVNPWETTTLKATHGKHFRAPTPNDLFWPETPYARGNPFLDPEKGWHTDATVEQSLFDDMLFLTLSYFYWELDSEIKWDVDSQGVWYPQNVSSSEANGCEFGVTVGPFFNLIFALSYTYTDAQEVQREYAKKQYPDPGGWISPGNPPPTPGDFRFVWKERRAAYTPEHQFKGDLTYVSDFGLALTTTLRYTGDRVWYQEESLGYPYVETVKYRLDDYWTLDIKVEQRLFEHWTLALSVNNVFDEEYETYFTSFYDAATGTTIAGEYPGAGRSVFFNVSFVY